MSEIYKEIIGVLGLSFLAQQTAIGLYKLGLPFIGGFMTIPLVFVLTYSIGKVKPYEEIEEIEPMDIKISFFTTPEEDE